VEKSPTGHQIARDVVNQLTDSQGTALSRNRRTAGQLFLVAISAAIAVVPDLSAQDWRKPRPSTMSSLGSPRTSSHVGTSPFSPRDEDDTLFVVDSGSGLDTGCTYRSGGPLRIHLLTKRFVGPVGSDGTLTSPNDLVARGLVSAKAHIRLPAFDIDVNGAPGYPPEVDRISFNGHDLGTLTGDNNVWKLNEFDVPIAWVKFPAMGVPGVAPAPADNVIEINIDEASAPDQNWCASVDWVEIEFSATAPIFLVHGTNAQSDTWEPDFTGFFNTSRAPWSNDINLEKNGSILGNGKLLGKRLLELGKSFGARKCHVIAHSKGGLDTRAYLNNNYEPDQLKVLSVYTLSTPHHGTIVSDIIVAKRGSVHPDSSNVDIEYLMDHDYAWASRFTPQEPAIGNQTTAYMANFNRDYPSIPGGILMYNYSADADLNRNGRIEADEAAHMFTITVLGVSFDPSASTAAAAGTAMYRTIGNVASIRIAVGTQPGRLWGTKTFTAIEVASINNPFATNDLVVSEASAHSPGGTYLSSLKANHTTMKSQTLAATILQRILADFPNR
jgi:triacylglycerol lipase